uniref:(2Fe-2S) ferredoxin n=1 Tax=Candidatus Kentrum sp. MB TaxID=2138164 RepID=A0A450XTF1_9GAMM|nr:MAG: (2Fe-2S) ferredoxin [Candidatus Kentron sp. MB]VFK32555.1 MAG: (2Fe-2S) ferredoxin [Candidatus Kentron sp. MB]VFK75976.1 MAG: (2Fe-2S) ferredoxin [Candidatus Kentron sp. MB]
MSKQKPKKHVFVCAQSRPADHPKGSCDGHGCQEILNEFQQEFVTRNLWEEFSLASTSCLGTCGFGPSVLVYPDSVMYGKVTKSDVKTIIEQHLLDDKPVADLQVPADAW